MFLGRENKSIQILETKNLGHQITDSENKFDMFTFKVKLVLILTSYLNF